MCFWDCTQTLVKGFISRKISTPNAPTPCMLVYHLSQTPFPSLVLLFHVPDGFGQLMVKCVWRHSKVYLLMIHNLKRNYVFGRGCSVLVNKFHIKIACSTVKHQWQRIVIQSKCTSPLHHQSIFFVGVGVIVQPLSTRLCEGMTV